MVRAIACAALMLLPFSQALAQDAAANDQAPTKIRSVTIKTGEKCPESTNGDIVVCQTLDEPYRIPKALRRSAPTAANRTWASRVEGIDAVGREGGGVPNSCSPTGTAGQSGCTQRLLEQWRAERREAQQNPGTPQ